jgi:hypothetical protein
MYCVLFLDVSENGNRELLGIEYFLWISYQNIETALLISINENYRFIYLK